MLFFSIQTRIVKLKNEYRNAAGFALINQYKGSKTVIFITCLDVIAKEAHSSIVAVPGFEPETRGL